MFPPTGLVPDLILAIMAGPALRCGITDLSSTLTLNYEILIYNLIQNSKDGLQQVMHARCLLQGGTKDTAEAGKNKCKPG
ncbi:hypothetical protein [Aquitalea denitrificans]|uniref:hypothetical protein n=1 Tax=Aquitalea denitrificans TaxID=519081 RepID=UPI00135CD822|nr:hypothetical protein [Aquitalea denitrificans]